MKTIFDTSTREELVKRIESLKANNTAQWGKMNVYQMTKHCNLWDEWFLGKSKREYKQIFLGKLFGKMALKNSVKDDKPIGRGAPAGSYWVVKEKTGDLEALKKSWIEFIRDYENYSNPNFIHDFFGKMSLDEIGIFAYKHSDHHLRQFGA